jgi:hypothetical protein
MSFVARLVRVGIMSAILSASGALAAEAPQFQVDPLWPKALPNNWILGQVAGIAVDAQDHVWIIQRPRTLSDDEKGATLDPPRSRCCAPAPPVIEFDRNGNVVQAWGGPGNGYDWPKNEHGIRVDSNGFVWIGGNAPDDGMILKFTREGKFVMQIGKPGPSKGDNDTTQLSQPADIWIDQGEAYVADGYGNHRVIVFDAETGAYKRHWGAYGKRPVDEDGPPGPRRRNLRQPGTLCEDRQRRARLCVRPHQQSHPGVPSRRHVREGIRADEGHARRRRGLGLLSVARQSPDLLRHRRRRE